MPILPISKKLKYVVSTSHNNTFKRSIACHTEPSLSIAIKAHTITSPKDIIETMKSFALSDRELLLGLYLNSRNQVIAHHVIHMGTANASLVHPMEVFKLAIMKNACSVIIAHNHPSGNIDPSNADLKMTQRLTEAVQFIILSIIAIS